MFTFLKTHYEINTSYNILFLKNKFRFSQASDAPCNRVNEFSIERRNQNYPFNQSKKILFVSYKESIEKLESFQKKKSNISPEEFIYGEIMSKYFKYLKYDYSRYDPDCFEEKIELNEDQRKELTDIIYNIGKNIDTNGMRGSGCYAPRNAILFFDENDKLFEYFIICFSCNIISPSVTAFSFNDDCTEKISLLEDLFEKVGIDFGVKKALEN